MDARFNKQDLIKRIQIIANLKNNIILSNEDFELFLTKYISLFGKDTFIYLDPPYFTKGKQLYLHYFTYNEHIRLRNVIDNIKYDWIISYDNTPEIKEIYKDYPMRKTLLNYSTGMKRKAEEIMIFKKKSLIPVETLF